MKLPLIPVALLMSSMAAAQPSNVHWSLSAGPSIAASRHDSPVCSPCAFFGAPASVQESRFIYGAEYGKYNVAFGVSWRWPATALVVRGEVMYNRSESAVRTSRPGYINLLFAPSNIKAQYAPRDEVFGGSVGLQWDALPDKAVSPYLLTSIGFALNRLSWNGDTASTRIDTQEDFRSPTAAFGAGVRVRLGAHEVFTEWRTLHAMSLPGAKITPFSIGFRF